MSKTFSKRSKQTRSKPWFNPDVGFDKMYDSKEYRACARKNGVYSHEKEALAAAKLIPRDDASNWRPYHCPYCKKYHLTSGKQK